MEKVVNTEAILLDVARWTQATHTSCLEAYKRRGSITSGQPISELNERHRLCEH